MKNNKIKFSLFGIIFETIWVFLGIATFLYFFSILGIPDEDQVIDVMRYYDFLGYTNVPETTVNIIMGLAVYVLIITVPLLVLNFKNLNNLRKDEFQRENGIFQVIAGVLHLFAFNLPASVLYILSGREILIQKPKIKKEIIESEFEHKEPLKLIISIFAFTMLIFLALIIIIPFYWMLLTSLMSKSTFANFTDVSLFLSFKEMNWTNLKEALTRADFGLYITNTIIVAVFSTLGTVITTILSAFAFSRLDFKGRDFIFTLLLMTMMIPGELYVITNFVTISNTFNWYNTFYALIVPFMTSVFYIFFLRQTFKQIPDSLYKAAKVDGCSDFKFLSRVMVPIATPTLITITILNALSTWNAYVWPRLVTEENHYLVSIALRTSFVNAATGRADYRLQMAAATLITVPILIIFLFARKYIMRGVGRSGIKG